MQVEQNYSLKPYNTFGLNVYAKQFAAFSGTLQLQQLLEDYRNENKLILGGGSNVLLRGDFDGICLKNELKGIELVREDQDYYYVKAAAGENWHAFVCYCITHKYAGVENLSLIPGCVGASPMQNIGAYGVEIKDVFYSLEALSRDTLTIRHFSNADCRFGYRESVFKSIYKDQYIILNVTFRLNKQAILHLEYGAIQAELQRMGIQNPDIQSVAEAVIHIRQSKLPDPKKIGNAGSFFKNPTISTTDFEKLQQRYPAIVGYSLEGKKLTKVAAGWLIESCGWKGYRQADYGVHKKQALVLVNYGQGSGEEIYRLSEQIIESVQQKFGIELSREVNII